MYQEDEFLKRLNSVYSEVYSSKDELSKFYNIDSEAFGSCLCSSISDEDKQTIFYVMPNTNTDGSVNFYYYRN